MIQALQFSETTDRLITGVYYASPASYASEVSGLSAIPPERVGLQGEYDYYGLAHRIQARFQDYMGKDEQSNIVVKQRGAAIILTGTISKAELLNDLVALAIATDGVTQVEVCNLAVQTDACEKVA